MWLSQTENISFTWLDGFTYNIKDVKTLESYERFIEIDLKKNERLDEIASRPEIFGEFAEDMSFLLFEANVEKIVENDFDLNKFKKLRIPVVS